MTRFARAKGSKSSNERVPNEATPWHVMKQQLQSSSESANEPQAKTKSARQLLNEKEDLYYPTSLGNVNTDWAEFDTCKKTNGVKNGKIKKKQKDQNSSVKKALQSVKPEETKQASKKAEKIEENIPEDVKEIKKSKKAKRKLENKLQIESAKTEDQGNLIKTDDTFEDKGKSVEKSDKLSKRQKRNKKKQNQKTGETSDHVHADPLNAEESHSNNSVNFNKRKKFDNDQDKPMDNGGQNNFKNKSGSSNFNEFKNFRRFGNNVPKKFQKKTAKLRDDKSHPRRKPDAPSMKVTINGMDVEIVKYDGFPVKKEDAQRLIELRKEMILKGIPKSEVDAAMKLERRKCEKALARIRKQVCFHCRKAGHNLSDCPELEKEEVGTGICFKCGSTEHTHFECKVHKSDDYKYAKCFICREQGHIAKQCPDNPKGLYPDGGSCKICGDVTHLKKDCPDLLKEKEEATITLDTIKDANLEVLDNEKSKAKAEVKATKKIVKF